MLNIQDCREVLEQYDYKLTDDEIVQLRDFLTMIAISQIIDNKEDKYEESITVLPSEQ